MPAPLNPPDVLSASIYTTNGSGVRGKVETHWEELGKGCYGTVYAGTLVQPGERRACAMKKFTDFQQFLHELKQLKLVRNVSGCIRVLGFVPMDDIPEWCILLDLCDGSWERRFGTTPNVPSFETVDCFLTNILGLCTTVRKLHKKELVHLDIKPANVLLGVSGGYWLADFGMLCREWDGPACWSEYGKADEPAGNWSDVFSTGATIVVILSWMFWGPDGVDAFSEQRSAERIQMDCSCSTPSFVVYYQCEACRRKHATISKTVEAQLEELGRAISHVVQSRLGRTSAGQFSSRLIGVLRGMLAVKHTVGPKVACSLALSGNTQATRLDMETVVHTLESGFHSPISTTTEDRLGGHMSHAERQP